MAGTDSALKTIGPAIMQRVQGERPGVPRALAGAAIAGTAAGVLVYRLLRG